MFLNLNNFLINYRIIYCIYIYQIMSALPNAVPECEDTALLMEKINSLQLNHHHDHHVLPHYHNPHFLLYHYNQ